MTFINFVVWLSTGAAIGWFARRMVEVERRRDNARALPPPEQETELKED